MSDEDIRRSLEQTYEMPEEQYGPERGRQMREMLKAQMEAYAGNIEPANAPEETRRTVVDPNRMMRVTRDTFGSELSQTMKQPIRIEHVRSFEQADLEPMERALFRHSMVGSSLTHGEAG